MKTISTTEAFARLSRNLNSASSRFFFTLSLILTLLFSFGIGNTFAEAYWPYAGFYEVYMEYSYSGVNTNYSFYSGDQQQLAIVRLGYADGGF